MMLNKQIADYKQIFQEEKDKESDKNLNVLNTLLQYLVLINQQSLIFKGMF